MNSTNGSFYPRILLASTLRPSFVVRFPFNRIVVLLESCRTIDRPSGLVGAIETTLARSNDTVEPYSKIGRQNPSRKHGWESLEVRIESFYCCERLQHPIDT